MIAGLGIADLPDFIVGDAIASGEVEVILKGWKQPEGAVHLVTPPGGPRPARVEVLAEFLAKHFAKGKKREVIGGAMRAFAIVAVSARLHCNRTKIPGEKTTNEPPRTSEGRRRAAAGANRIFERGLRAKR